MNENLASATEAYLPFSDEIVAGAFGVLATLAGVVVTYWLVTKREEVNELKRLHSALFAVIDNLEHVLKWYDKGSDADPNISSIEVLRSQGLSSNIPNNLALQLSDFYFQIQKIYRITAKIDTLFTSMVISGDYTRVAQEGSQTSFTLEPLVKDRQEAIKEMLNELPDLIKGLKGFVDRGHIPKGESGSAVPVS